METEIFNSVAMRLSHLIYIAVFGAALLLAAVALSPLAPASLALGLVFWAGVALIASSAAGYVLYILRAALTSAA